MIVFAILRMAGPDPSFRFDVYELRSETRRLLKQGIKVKLRPQPFQILSALLKRSGEIVTREELRELLWSKETFVDFEHSLNTAIKELRAVLNDSASSPRFIETVPRVGYRIIVPVEAVEPNGRTGVHPLAETPTAVALDEKHPHSAIRKWQFLLAFSVVLIAVAGYFLWRRPLNSTQANGRIALAVLPFENLTGDPSQEYLGDGLTEELISQLGQMDSSRLGVIARASVMHYKDNHEPLEKIGRSLQVQYALQGSVRRDGEKLRVSAQLMNMKGQTLWSHEYDRQNGDLLSIQGEIAREISDEISTLLGGSKSAVAAMSAPTSTVSNEAYDFYLRGTYSLNKRNVPELQRAILYFQQAIAKNPDYAAAYASLSNSYTLLAGYSGRSQVEYKQKAREAALHALDLDPNLPEAHVSLAVIAQNYDWDWHTAENEYRKAIELNPNYATAHHWYAEQLAFEGRFDEAFAEVERARQLDPLSLIIAADRGVMLYYARRYDESIQQFNAVLQMEPTFLRGGLIIYPEMQKHLYPDVYSVLDQELRINGENGWYWAAVAYVSGQSGKQSEALHALAKAREMNQHEPLDPGVFLWANLGIGNKEEFFVWLEKAHSQHSNILTTLKVEPAFDPVRDDPRFVALERRIGLAQ